MRLRRAAAAFGKGGERRPGALGGRPGDRRPDPINTHTLPTPSHTPHPTQTPPQDFIGVSGYAPLTGRPLGFAALEVSWETAAYEFGLFGISVLGLAAAGKNLIYA